MLFKTSKNLTDTKQSSDLIPKHSRDDDIFLVSYPRSGVTWISFLIANIISKTLNLNMTVNHFNIHGFVPDIHQGIDIPLDLGFFPFKRIIKSHSQYNPYYKNIIYILRDPRSVMVSYHKFLQGLEEYDGTVSDLIDDPRYGVVPWVNHLSEWVNGINPSIRFRIVKYEDFKQDTQKALCGLAFLLGIDLNEDTAEEIVNSCSIENMRRLENETRTLSIDRKDTKFEFVRSGSINSWKEDLTEKDISRIESVAYALMKEHGYL